MSHSGQLVRLSDPFVAIVATLETIPGQARLSGGRILHNGQLSLDYAGGTEIDWNSQVSIQTPKGRLFVAEDGAIVPETEVGVSDDNGVVRYVRRVDEVIRGPAGGMASALHQAVLGRRVRRESWPEVRYLYHHAQDGFLIGDLSGQDPARGWSPERLDVDAADWVVIGGVEGPPAPPAGGSPAAGVAEAPAGPLRAYSASRLAERVADGGLETLNGRELLELYISRTRPRGAAGLAEALLGRFLDLQHVVGASLSELGQVVDQDLAIELKLLQDAGLGLLKAEVVQRPVVSTWSALLAYVRLKHGGASAECFHVLFLDTRNQLIADEVMNRGTIDHAPVYPREIMRRALEVRAKAVILVHPHPSGDSSPSQADIVMTKLVVEAARPLGIAVHDHLVVGAGGVTSFKAQGLI